MCIPVASVFAKRCTAKRALQKHMHCGTGNSHQQRQPSQSSRADVARNYSHSLHTWVSYCGWSSALPHLMFSTFKRKREVIFAHPVQPICLRGLWVHSTEPPVQLICWRTGLSKSHTHAWTMSHKGRRVQQPPVQSTHWRTGLQVQTPCPAHTPFGARPRDVANGTSQRSSHPEHQSSFLIAGCCGCIAQKAPVQLTRLRTGLQVQTSPSDAKGDSRLETVHTDVGPAARTIWCLLQKDTGLGARLCCGLSWVPSSFTQSCEERL